MDTRTGRIRRSIQKLLVAGTMGAYFSALIRSVAVDTQAGLTADIHDRLLRYAFVLWYLLYFFVSNTNNEHGDTPTAADVWFDVVQSVTGLTVAVLLGLAVPNVGFGVRHMASASAAGLIGIAVIGGFSHFLFHRQPHPPLQRLRLWATCVAVVSAVATIAFRATGQIMWLVDTALMTLWAMLIRYTWIRLGKA